MTASRVEHLAEGVTIYGLHRPGSRKIRYIGKTTGSPLRRLTYHLQTAKRGNKRPLCCWLRRCIADGQRPAAAVLEVVPPGSDWAKRERYWIGQYRNCGARLFNMTDGGEGLSGYSFTAEHRQRIAIKLRRGSRFKCEQCPKTFWRKPNEIKSGDCRFCSRGCYQASLRGKPNKVSQICKERGIAAAAAVRRNQTHCKRGHPLSGSNLFFTSARGRGCKECRKLHKRKYLDSHR